MKYLQVINWDRFQHYKDRLPPWIKLHRSLLSDYKIASLPDAAKAHLVSLWVVASECDNKIPDDPKWIGRHINATQPVDLQRLIDDGFLREWTSACKQDASKMLADCKQDASKMLALARSRESESETETETETDNTRDGRAAAPPVCVDPLASHPVLAAAYPDLQAAITAAHPLAKIPKPDSAGDRAWRKTLAQLVHLDKYSEADVLAVITWALKTAPQQPGGFCWGDQVQSLAALRKTNGAGDATKFAKIHGSWERDKRRYAGVDMPEDDDCGF